MTLYRVTYAHEGGSSLGYGWFSNRTAALRAAADFRRKTRNEDGAAQVEPVPISGPLTKRVLLDLLNHYGTYPDNG
jgi:hypothetical protein